MNNLKPHCDPGDFPLADVYAVIGNPIAHSRSPEIHTLFAKQTNQAIHYGKIYSEVAEFEKNVIDFFSRGGRGINVTVPFKDRAYLLSEVLTPRAKAAGVVNVLWMVGGKIYGDNSDGIGLVRDLIRNHVLLKNQKILLLGAGGAAQGVLLPLLEMNPQSITVVNRTYSKAKNLVDKFIDLASVHHVQLNVVECEDIGQIGPFDLIINATASGLSQESPLLDEQIAHLVQSSKDSAKTTTAYDMVYGKETKFLTQMLNNQAHTIDGLGILVEQAAESFEKWRGAEVIGKLDTSAVLEMLRA